MHVYIDTHTGLSFQQQSVSQGSGNFQLPDGFTWEEWELMEKDGQGHGQDIDSWVRELKFLEFKSVITKNYIDNLSIGVLVSVGWESRLCCWCVGGQLCGV